MKQKQKKKKRQLSFQFIFPTAEQLLGTLSYTNKMLVLSIPYKPKKNIPSTGEIDTLAWGIK